MVARTGIFDHGRLPLGKQPREKNRTFDLSAGDRQPVGNAVERPPLDHKRRALLISFGTEVRTHLLQRLDHPAHRTLGKRGVARHSTTKVLRCKEPGHQAHRRARVPAIDVAFRRSKSPSVPRHHDGAWRRSLDLDTELPHRVRSAAAVFAFKKIGNRTCSVGDR